MRATRSTVTHVHPTRLGRAAGGGGGARLLPGDPMASEDLAGALAAVLGGRGLRVQSYDSGPAGETPAQVRLRKNVCYVVLAVFLNEQVSVRPSGPPPRPPGLAGNPGGDRGHARNSHRFLVCGSSQFCKALSYLHLSLVQPNSAIVPMYKERN